jgi:enediyne biosynthesis protein E4
VNFPSRLRTFIPPLLITGILLAAHISFGILDGWLKLTTAIAAAFVTEIVLSRFVLGKWRNLTSAYISGISAGILVRSPLLWPFAFTAAVSIASKYAIRFRGRHVFNPTNFGIVMLLMVASDSAAVLSIQWGNNMWAMAIIWIVGFLSIHKLKRFHVCAAYIASFLVFGVVRSWISGDPVLAEIAPLTGPMYQLFVLFMITDPRTSLSTTRGRVIVALLIGFVEFIFRLNEAIYAPFYALFIVGPIALMLEIWWKDRTASTGDLARPASVAGPVVGSLLVLSVVAACGDRRTEAPGELEWVQEEGFRWAELARSGSTDVGFESLPSNRTGIGFRNEVTDEQAAANRSLLNGSGVALGDVTGNGFPDVYFARIDGPNVLYENLGAYRFRDITDEAGVALPDQYSTGATFADLNGNGHLDLVVTSNDATNKVFFNDGAGQFTERTGALPALRNYGSTTVAAGDLTGNGAVDLYIVNYKVRSARDIYPYESQMRFLVEEVDGEPRIVERFREHYELGREGDVIWTFELAEPDLLYLNDGNGNFEYVPLDSGVLLDEDGEPITEELLDWGLHARLHDMTGNGLPDIYVANDFDSPDRIWINQGDGTFRALDRLAMRKSSFSSMAVDFSDLDRDGTIDFLVVEMLGRDHRDRLRHMETSAPFAHPVGEIENRPQYMGNTLFRNRGDGTWAEISEFAGVRRTEWSWSAFFFDIDLDGYEDLVVANGHFADIQDVDTNNEIDARVGAGQLDPALSILEFPPLRQRNMAFRNRGDLTFEEVSESWGFTEVDISHGMAMADLNNNGVLDLVVNRLDDEASVYRNLTDRPRVAVRLRDAAPNTQGAGSTIRFLGGPVPQSRETVVGGAYLSGSAQQYVFAVGDSGGPFTIQVDWRDGTRSVLEGVEANRVYEIDGASINRQPRPEAGADLVTDEADGPWFRTASEELDHVHHEERFQDGRQPLLPLDLSQEGPAVSFFDWTGNGSPDLFIGSGKGGSVAHFENRNGTFVRAAPSGLVESVPMDHAAILGYDGADGEKHLLVGISSYEGGPGEDSRILHYVRRGPSVELVGELSIPGAAMGPMAMADLTGDGIPELFVGGRLVPGRYPEAAPSYLFRNVEGRFELDEALSGPLQDVGMVTGAVFSDLTGNGVPELVLATDWGPIRIMAFPEGEVVERTAEYGLDRHVGWWRGVATGDLTGDGRPDIVATNHGLNFRTRNLPGNSTRLFYADFNRNGFHEIIESYRDEGLDGWVPRKSPTEVGPTMPFMMQNVGSFSEYASSTIGGLLGPRYADTRYVEASDFAHMAFLNEEGGFRAEPLPTKAQFAPAFGVIVADFDGDGHEDVVLSQNFFPYDVGTPRADAGRGLLLRGDGAGGLAAVPGRISGIRVYGEQRGMATADLDGDGRLDLIISQNGAPTQLLRNERATPGIRVGLQGPATNPMAIGASVRLVFDSGEPGPIREVQVGSGYLSQQSTLLVLGHGNRRPSGIQIRWPDGTATRHDLEPDQGEIMVRWDAAGADAVSAPASR